MNEYLAKVIEIIINKTGMDPEEISEDSYFEDDLNVGEIDLIEIIGALEEEYKIEFEEEEKEKLKSVMDIVEVIVEKVE
jgi:acyl carrier protein